MPSRSPAIHRAPASAGQYELDILPGLEPIARDELAERFGRSVTAIVERPGALQFDFTGDPAALLNVRSCVAVYQVLTFDVPRPRALLGHAHLTRLLAAIRQVIALQRPGAFATFRLSAAGSDSSILTRFKDELAGQLALAISDEGDLFLRLRRGAGGWDMLVRLSPRPSATRSWRVCNFPGAMNASLAYAMARLTQPTPGDVVVNLCCGSGTLLIERLLIGPAQRAIGCDIDVGALECAAANLEAAGLRERVRLEACDAAQTPLATGSVDVILADLPFGQLIGTHADNLTLYPDILREAARITRPGGRIALLSHEVRLLEQSAAETAEYWQVEKVIRVRSSGMTPGLFVLRRTS